MKPIEFKEQIIKQITLQIKINEHFLPIGLIREYGN
jgi:hypothetical protein